MIKLPQEVLKALEFIKTGAWAVKDEDGKAVGCVRDTLLWFQLCRAMQTIADYRNED